MSRVRLNIKSVEKRREWRGSLARERCNHLVKTRLLCREESRETSRAATPIPIPVGLWTCCHLVSLSSRIILALSLFSAKYSRSLPSFPFLDSVDTVDEKSWNGAWHDPGCEISFFGKSLESEKVGWEVWYEEKRVAVEKYIFSRGFETRLEETGTDFTTTLARRNRKTARGATVLFSSEIFARNSRGRSVEDAIAEIFHEQQCTVAR